MGTTVAGRAVALAVAALALTGCAAAPPAGPDVAPDERVLLSIGDSYAAGYQPGPDGTGSTTTNGFAYQLADGTSGWDEPVRLVNFGCSGVTSTGLLGDRGCAEDALGPGGAAYPGRTQAAAAADFLEQHGDRVALVTIVVGGNDVLPCLESGSADPARCVTDAVTTLSTNLAELLGELREAAGPAVPIIGLTYPDPLLGAWTSGSPDARTLATGSVPVFRDALNPALQAAYAAAGAGFVDVTAAAGAYGSLTDTVEDATWGTVPVPVAQACALTFYCRYGDVHATTEGHRLIADEIRAAVGVS